MSVRTRTRRRTALGPLLVVWISWLVLMAGANLATPLYAVYAKEFSFSSLTLTLVFATYAVVLVPSLLIFGRLSDRLGRKSVMFGGLVVAGVALSVFAAATAVAWLYAARALQGLGVGMISGPATAALVEVDPDSSGQRPAMLAGLAQAGGSGLGPLVAGMLAEWAPAPLHLSFLVWLTVTVVAAATLLLVLPAESRRGDEPWRIQRPRVPQEILPDFFRAGLTAGIVCGPLQREERDAAERLRAPATGVPGSLRETGDAERSGPDERIGDPDGAAVPGSCARR